MKIAWITSLPGIASARLSNWTAPLSVSAAGRIELFDLGVETLGNCRVSVKKVRIDDLLQTRVLASFDVVVYYVNYGDPQNERLLECSLRHPGICVVADWPRGEADVDSDPRPTEWLLQVTRSSYGVIVHSAEDLSIVERQFPGAVAHLSPSVEPGDALSYGRRFVEFAKEILEMRPLLMLSDRIGAECARLGLDDDSPVVESVAHQLADLFGSKNES